MTERRDEIAANLARVQGEIESAATSVGRSADEITLIAVTKTFPISDAQILASLGVKDFGENRDSDGAEKAAAISGRWHFQGQIQTNKLKSISTWADVIHSIDDLRHIEIIESKMEKPSIDIFIQVSLDGAQGRGGVAPEQLSQIADAAVKAEKTNLLGIMAVAPLGQVPSIAFEKLAAIHATFKANYPQSPYLSAGMSSDFQEAISFGATHIRIGSSILGLRPSPQ